MISSAALIKEEKSKLLKMDDKEAPRKAKKRKLQSLYQAGRQS